VLHEVLSDLAAGTGAGFVLFSAVLGVIVLLYQPSRGEEWESAARGKEWARNWGLTQAVAGLVIASFETALSIAPPSFGLLLSRRILRLASRTTLTIGLTLSSLPPAFTSGETGQDEKKTRRPPPRELGGTETSLRSKIGRPVKGSFRKMDCEGTRAFHALRGEGEGGNDGDGNEHGVLVRIVSIACPAPARISTGSV
jgi:hypothetical protein